MMLQGFLYELTGKEEGSATIKLIPSCPIYKAHFPGYPITPGVCLVEIALELIAEMADQVGHDERVRLVGAKNIKFTSPIIPVEGMELRFNLGGEGSERTVEILSGETLCAKMSLSVA